MHKENKIRKEIISLIEDHVNIKKVEIKTHGHGKKEIKVELNTKLTTELETEGYTREFIRKIQSSRRKAGLKKQDKIELELYLEDDSLIKSIKKYKLEKLIEEKTNAKINLLSTGELRKKRKHTFEVKIKNKIILIFFDIKK